VRVDSPAAGKTGCGPSNNACAKCGDLGEAARWAASDDDAALACARAASSRAKALFSRHSLLLYLKGVLERVAGLQRRAGYDVAAALADAHGSGGSGGGGGGAAAASAAPTAPTAATAASGGPVTSGAAPLDEAGLLARLDAECGHRDDKGNCAEAARLVAWWLSLPGAAYTGARDPPCREDICARCCGQRHVGRPAPGEAPGEARRRHGHKGKPRAEAVAEAGAGGGAAEAARA